MFAIGHRRVRSIRVVLLMAFVRDLLARDFLPENFARVAVHTNHSPLINLRRWGASTAAPARSPASSALSARSTALLTGRRLLDLSECDHRRIGYAAKRVTSIGSLRFCFLARGNRRQHENFIAPNNRRGITIARDFEFPLHIFGLAPFRGRIALRGDAVLERPA